MHPTRAVAALALILSACADDLDADRRFEPPAIEYSERFVMAAATESYSPGFGAAIEGAAMGWTDAPALIGAVSIVGGAGSVEVDGAVHTVALRTIHPWPEHEMTLYHGVVTLPDRLYLMWFYCADGRLFTVYAEGTDGTPMTYQPARGTCVEVPAAPVTVALPALDMPVPPLDGSFVVQGHQAEVDGAAPGWVVVGDRRMAMYGFQRVDCATCGTPGWQELHGLLWDEAGPSLHIGTLYLHPGGRVQLTTWWARPTQGTVNDDIEARWRLAPMR